MVTEVEVNGTILEFPDGMSREQILSATRKFSAQQTPPQQPQQDTVSQLEIAQAEEEAIASGRLGTSLTFGITPQERQAQAQVLTPSPAEFVGGIGQLTKQIGLDIPGGIAGTAGGAALGSAFGPIGTIGGGIIGGIAGATAGKQGEVALGIRPEETVLSSVGQSVLEEGLGRLGGLGINVIRRAIPDAITAPIIAKARELAPKFGINLDKTPIEKTFLSAQDIDPTDFKLGDIIEAQDNVLGDRLLTTFEETGGQIGGGEFRKLLDRVSRIQTQGQSTSTALATRKVINKRIQSKLGDFDNIKFDALMKTDTELGKSIQASFAQASKSFSPQLGVITQELRKLRPQAKIPIEGMEQQIESLFQDATIELGEKDAVLLFKEIREWLPKSKIVDKKETFLDNAGLIQTRTIQDTIPAIQIRSFADFKRLDKNIESTLPNFQASQEKQKAILGWYAGNIKPIIKDFKLTAVKQSEPDSLVARANASEELLASIKKQETAIRKSRIFQKVGGSEGRQELKGAFTDDILDKIFDNPQVWEQTVAALKRTNPELIEILQGRFKAQIVKDVFDPKTGDISFTKISSLRKKIGDDTITAIGGEDYFKSLVDSQQISLALEASKQLPRISATLTQPVVNEVKGLFRTLQRGVVMFNWATTGLKKGFNIDTVTDEKIFRKLQGKNGQELFERMLSTPLDSPEAYNVYSELVRDIIKGGDFLNRTEFESKVKATFSDLGIGQQTQQ